ncbi:hypothetical protein C8J56DRAFT_964802 [Mycena floridula]|nr:hypothetical protein C8J56DRAFT_964802 [Mycena floridula]
MTSAVPETSTTTAAPVNRHALTAVERQRAHLDRLLKDPVKPAFIPPPPQEKTIRPAREMMKNVQGSSAGAGSGEFHVYKAGRRREYERLKLLEDEVQKEAIASEFDQKRKAAEDEAEAKTAKNRAKRQKKKERSKNKTEEVAKAGKDGADAPIKKRRLVNGKELVFRRPGEESDEEDEEASPALRSEAPSDMPPVDDSVPPPRAVEEHKIIIHDD